MHDHPIGGAMSLEPFTPARDERIVDIIEIQSATVVDEHGVTHHDAGVLGVPNLGVPTQVANPKRASWRTFAQSLVSFLVVLNAAALALLPVILDPANGLEAALGPVYGYLVLGLNVIVFVGSTVSKALAALMAKPIVNAW